MYDWVTLLYSRNWYNIVNQLYFNKKNQKKRNFSLPQIENSLKFIILLDVTLLLSPMSSLSLAISQPKPAAMLLGAPSPFSLFLDVSLTSPNCCCFCPSIPVVLH